MLGILSVFLVSCSNSNTENDSIEKPNYQDSKDDDEKQKIFDEANYEIMNDIESNNSEEKNDEEDVKEVNSLEIENSDYLLNGYWDAYDVSDDASDFTYDSQFQGESFLSFDTDQGEMGLVEYGYGTDTFEDFIFNKPDKGSQSGIGLTYQEHWNRNYSMKDEFTVQKINENISLLRIVSNYHIMSASYFILERVSKESYKGDSNGYNSSENEREKAIEKAQKLNDDYKDKILEYFGSFPYEDIPWVIASDDFFGTLGRGGTLEFNEEQQSEFKGNGSGETDFDEEYNEDTYNKLYYSFSEISDHFTVSNESEKYNVITLISKGGIMDATLYAENQDAKEARDAIINYLIKATNDVEGIDIKVTDSNGHTQFGILHGNITYDKLNDAK